MDKQAGTLLLNPKEGERRVTVRNRASQIANYFLSKAEESSEALTMLKLIKLCYIAHGWVLATTNKDLLGGEAVEAWQHGPVIPSLYHEFKKFGRSRITSKASELIFEDFDDGDDFFGIKSITPEVNSSSDEAGVLDYVWAIYRQYSSFDLVDMTHQRDTPWSMVYQPGERNIEIPNNSIKDFYARRIDELIQNVELSPA